MRAYFALGVAAILTFGACGGSPPPAPTTTTMTVPAASAPPVASVAPAAPVPPSASSAAPGASPKGKLCGCSLCEPAISEDACSADADCAPSTPCHAEQCVAKAKAIPRKPGEMCTMLMNCASADANACGCFKGKCALTPRKQ